MAERLKINIKPTITDTLIEALGWLFLLAIWILTIASYTSLPDTIPIHYNGAGQVNGFGAKANILTLPFIVTILFIGLTVLNKFPHLFNYPVHITQDNALNQYTIATRLIRYLKTVITLVFGLITFKTIQNANGVANGMGAWFLPLALGLIFIPILYFGIQFFKQKR